ncbi:TaqI restriction endonuclease [Lentzea atacamensis]|uniref:site-specific DNA-methyltransferase (adenine-specific) n=1 Tax=Lentzea atacamensis TaxID=531938 RepID=A0ABX9E6Y8_9PSEU|nr:TaqI restriction endonuclease [Lentzea atacamensis]
MVATARQVGREKLEGVHYTPAELAGYVARKLLSYGSFPKGRAVKVLDPACGDGELLLAIARELAERGVAAELVGTDTDANAIEVATERLANTIPGVSFRGDVADFLLGLAKIDREQPASLFDLGSVDEEEKFDLIIANPPYVRTQHLGSERAQELGRRFGLTGRVDLYQAFIAAFQSVLDDNGSFGIIVPNRFLVTKGGESIRRLLASRYQVNEIIDLGDTKQFAAAVLPAIVFASNIKVDSQKIPVSSIYSVETGTQATSTAASIYDALDGTPNGAVQVGTSTWTVERGEVVVQPKARFDAPWVSRSSDLNFLAAVDEASYARFSDLGKIRVGVKSTADKVFIRRSWDELEARVRPERELLHPLVSSDTAERWNCRHSALSILYPYDMTNRKRVPLDISRFPRAAAYLELHREQLSGRKYVIDAGRHWWEIWVPQKPADWAAPKIVFPDISTNGKFAIDRTGALVNGNCYWISLSPEQEDLGYLAVAVANSSLAMRYYDARFGNKLYAGRRRFISQYVDHFPLPDPGNPAAKRAAELARELEGTTESAPSLEREVEAAVWSAFGLEQS